MLPGFVLVESPRQGSGLVHTAASCQQHTGVPHSPLTIPICSCTGCGFTALQGRGRWRRLADRAMPPGCIGGQAHFRPCSTARKGRQGLWQMLPRSSGLLRGQPC